MNTRQERLKLVADKKDRSEERARRVFIFKQKINKTLKVTSFRYVGSK